MKSKPQQKKIRELEKRAYKLHLTGMTTRDIGAVIGKSHTWVANAVRKLSTENE